MQISKFSVWKYNKILGFCSFFMTQIVKLCNFLNFHNAEITNFRFLLICPWFAYLSICHILYNSNCKIMQFKKFLRIICISYLKISTMVCSVIRDWIQGDRYFMIGYVVWWLEFLNHKIDTGYAWGKPNRLGDPTRMWFLSISVDKTLHLFLKI